MTFLVLGIIVAYLAVGLALGRLFTTRYVRNSQKTSSYSVIHENSVILAFVTLVAWPVVLAVVVVRLFFRGLYKVLMKAMLPAELNR